MAERGGGGGGVLPPIGVVEIRLQLKMTALVKVPPPPLPPPFAPPLNRLTPDGKFRLIIQYFCSAKTFIYGYIHIRCLKRICRIECNNADLSRDTVQFYTDHNL